MRRTRAPRLPPLALLLAFTLGACSQQASEPPPTPTIARETFVEAYVRLRATALAYPAQEIPLLERDRILNELGVTEEDLLTFVEVHGTDADLMQGIWEEVDARFREMRRGSVEEGGGEPGPP